LPHNQVIKLTLNERLPKKTTFKELLDPMKRFNLLLGILSLIALTGFSGEAKSGRPNILFILSDDHSAPYVGCYGQPGLKTPVLDKLAADGMRFNRFFCGAPQCVPSRATMLTGRSAVAARITRFSSPLARDEIVFPEVLRKDGNYYTGVCGRSYHLDGSGIKDPLAAKVGKRKEFITFPERMDFVETGDQFQVHTRMEAFLDQVPSGRPFFLWVNYSDPHHVWNAQDFQPDPAILKIPAHWPDTQAMREALAAYIGEVNRLDGLVGKVLDILEKRNLSQNTMVVFVGDNGMALPHGKGSLYDPGLNTPLFVRWPGVVKPGQVTDELISGEDFGPTLLAAAGLTAPARMSGSNFVPLLRNEPYQSRKYIFAERGPHGSAPIKYSTKASGVDYSRCVRSARYKFIYNATPWLPYSPVDSAGNRYWKEMTEGATNGTLSATLVSAYFRPLRPIYEFYDLQADPSELDNLSGKPEVDEIEKELRIALVEKMIADFDYLPLPDLTPSRADVVPGEPGPANTVSPGKKKKKR
jgi:arylsulfatase A-like enzyme